MIIASGNCTITTNKEDLDFLKKESEEFSSHKVEFDFDSINLTKPLFVGDKISIHGMHVEITAITDKVITGWTFKKDK